MYVTAHHYICVLVLLFVSAYYYICVLILLYMCVLILLYLCQIAARAVQDVWGVMPCLVREVLKLSLLALLVQKYTY